MPEKLTEDDLSPLAAEYVLGTLEADERTRAGVLLDVDPKFRETVRLWERRLGELHLMVEPVTPDSRIWERIRGKLGHAAAERVIHRPEPLDEPEPDVEEDPAPVELTYPAPARSAPQPLVPRSPVPKPPEPVKAEVAKPEKAESPDTDAEEAEATPEQKLTELILSAERFSANKAAEQKAAEQGSAERVARDAESRPASGPMTSLGSGPGLPPVPGLGPVSDDEELPPPPPSRVDPLPDLDRAVERPSLPAAVNERSRALVRADEDKDVAMAMRSAQRWRRCAVAMTAVAVLLVTLMAAWRFIPNHLPSALSPTAFLNIQGPGIRKSSSTLTQFDE